MRAGCSLVIASCSRRFVCPRRALRVLTGNSYSTAAKRDFASFFFPNTQWVNVSDTGRSAVRRIAHAVAEPALPSTAFRHTDVLSPRRLLKLYAQLSKFNLTALVVLTSMSGVALSPLPTTVPILLSTAVGTALCAACANTLNQLQEVPFDAQMARTRSRPLVRRAISPLHASGFAAVTGVAGISVLWAMVNPTTAILGATNIALYAGAYTYLKRKSVWNTAVGSVVGGIPPLMGWTACGGKLVPASDASWHLFLPNFLSQPQPLDMSSIDNPIAPLALFMLLYSWQFAHFNPLSHLVRASYAQAGYKMFCVLSPQKNARIALRHALILTSICSVLVPLSGLTTWWFAVTSLIPNAVFLRATWYFFRFGGEKEARAAFQHSLWYLPVVLGLMMLHKQGTDWRKWLGLSPDKVDSIGDAERDAVC